MARRRDINFEDARITFKNFAGKEGAYNPAGRRNFSILLSPEQAADLSEEGWNVKYLEPREDSDEPQAHLSVQVRFDNIPPKVVLIADGAQSQLDEDSIDLLDFADIESTDIIVTPYYWSMNGKSGIKAYLKAIYVTIRVDEFERKYKNIPDSAINTIGKKNRDVDD